MNEFKKIILIEKLATITNFFVQFLLLLFEALIILLFWNFVVCKLFPFNIIKNIFDAFIFLFCFYAIEQRPLSYATFVIFKKIHPADAVKFYSNILWSLYVNLLLRSLLLYCTWNWYAHDLMNLPTLSLIQCQIIILVRHTLFASFGNVGSNVFIKIKQTMDLGMKLFVQAIHSKIKK